MEVIGTLYKIFETNQVSENFKKREFVLEYAENPAYPQIVKFQLNQDRTALLDNLKIGDAVKVEFSLRGREWTNPQGEIIYFTSLEAWKMEVIQPEQTQTANQEQTSSSESAQPVDLGNSEDDLPF